MEIAQEDYQSQFVMYRFSVSKYFDHYRFCKVYFYIIWRILLFLVILEKV